MMNGTDPKYDYGIMFPFRCGKEENSIILPKKIQMGGLTGRTKELQMGAGSGIKGGIILNDEGGTGNDEVYYTGILHHS